MSIAGAGLDRAIALRQSELAAKCKQQRDEWIDLMFKPRIASPPRVAAPPQVPGGPPRPKKKKGKHENSMRVGLVCRTWPSVGGR